MMVVMVEEVVVALIAAVSTVVPMIKRDGVA